MKNSIILLLLFHALSVSAQDDDRTPRVAPSFSLTTIPVRCILRDWNIGMTKSLNVKQTVEVRIGYVHHNNLLHRYYEEWLTSTEMRFKGPSVYFQWNFWRMTSHNKHWYFGPIVGYRYLWYNQESLWLGGTGGSSFAEEPVLSQWRNDLILLFAVGRMSTKVTCTEVSLGGRVSQTHTFVNDTRFHPAGQSAEEYEQYKNSVKSQVPDAEGFSIWPVVRITTRIGKFEW